MKTIKIQYEEVIARLINFVGRHHHELAEFDIINKHSKEDASTYLYDDALLQIIFNFKLSFARIKFNTRTDNTSYGKVATCVYDPSDLHVVTYYFDEHGYIYSRHVDQLPQSAGQQAQQ